MLVLSDSSLAWLDCSEESPELKTTVQAVVDAACIKSSKDADFG